MNIALIVVSLFSIIELSQSGPCAQLPPDLEKLTHGIDVTRFDLFPPDFTGDNGYGKPIFGFTCDKAKKWQNSYTNETFDLPDQIESIAIIPGGVLNKETEISVNYQDSVRSTGQKLGISLLGMFSLSRSHQKIMEKITTHHEVLTTVHSHVSAHAVEMSSFWKEMAGATMKGFMDHLPDTYAADANAYQKFVNEFGTHYFQIARFGGVIRVESDTTKNYALEHTAKTIELQAGIAYMNILGAEGGHTQDQQPQDAAYHANTTTQAFYYGGTSNPNKHGASLFQSWVVSAEKDPWIFGGQMESILNFLPNGPKKTAVQTAIAVKLDWAYLDELAHSLNILKLNPLVNQVGANNLLKQVKAERVKPIPPHDGVVILGQEVEAFVNAEKGKETVKPICKVVHDKKLHKDVCVQPTTCICKLNP
jgi:hypothetical protein